MTLPPFSRAAFDTAHPFTPARAVHANTPAVFDAAYRDARPGDLIVADGLVYPGCWWPNRKLSGPVMFDLTGARFTGTATTGTMPAVYPRDTSNHLIYGGDVTSTTGQGIRLAGGNVGFVWWGFTVHDCAGSGILCQGEIGRSNEDCELRGTVRDCGWDYQRLDPHFEKGTGVHACDFGKTGLPPEIRGEVVLDVPRQPYGAAFQAGHCIDCRAWIRGCDLLFTPQQQRAGNIIQPWGRHVGSVFYGEGDNVLHGCDPLIETGDVTVETGLVSNVRVPPAWVPGNGVRYTDPVAPAPAGVPFTVTDNGDGRTITLHFKPVPGATGGYRLFRDGKSISSSLDPNKSTWRVDKPATGLVIHAYALIR